MTEKIFDYRSNYGYEQVLLFQNEDVGLRAVFAADRLAKEPIAQARAIQRIGGYTQSALLTV